MNQASSGQALPVFPDIHTSRLDLIAVTPEILRREQYDVKITRTPNSPRSRSEFEAMVRAEVPTEWPPQDWEPHVLEFLLRQMAANPMTAGWARLVALRNPSTGHRTLIGTVGAVPSGTEMDNSASGEIEVGYGILPSYQRRGFATEALGGMMDWVKTQDSIPIQLKAFVAQTFPHLTASIRVLEKSGFICAGQGFEDGTILFRRTEAQSIPNAMR